MLIDWFTVTAQIVNFLILVALLKYFLYDRIIQAMEKREENIRNRLEGADQKEAEAEKEAESYRRKQADIENERREILDKARQEADNKRRELAGKARAEVEELQKKWKTGIRKEKEAFVRDIRRMAAREVFTIARDALSDLADVDIEAQVSTVFLRRIQEMKKKDLKEIAESAQDGDRQVLVRSGHAVSTQMRQKITRTIHQRFAEGLDVEYETAPELLLGIEVKTKSRKIVWSLEDYLTDLEEAAVNILEAAANEP